MSSSSSRRNRWSAGGSGRRATALSRPLTLAEVARWRRSRQRHIWVSGSAATSKLVVGVLSSPLIAPSSCHQTKPSHYWLLQSCHQIHYSIINIKVLMLRPFELGKAKAIGKLSRLGRGLLKQSESVRRLNNACSRQLKTTPCNTVVKFYSNKSPAAT